MKDTQILWTNWFTEWFKPRLVSFDSSKSHLSWIAHVRILDITGEEIMQWELNEEDYITTKTINKLINDFQWDKWTVKEVAITGCCFILFIYSNDYEEIDEDKLRSELEKLEDE